MTDAPLAFCFGVHNHQPIGNFDGVLRETSARAYRPFLEVVRARPEIRLTMHGTGSLLTWLREHERATFDLLGAVVADGRVELLTGGFYEPILAILPDSDKRGQVERLTEFLRAEFGVRPRGMWLAERVWEPQLPRALREAGVEYVLVDDRHFALAGLDPDDLGGYYLTEDQGVTLGVFPINERLRHLIPFAPVDRSLEYLADRHHRQAAVTVMDDGEKFGAWPGTYRHVYEEGWLDAFFDRVLATPWLQLATFADVVDATPPVGRVYLPTASYQEMGEWALPAAAGRMLEEARRSLRALEGGEQVTSLLRGGFWRNFLVKYPEIGDLYWKMQRLSSAVERRRRERPGDTDVLAAREALWRGQANDAYWHGVFGGCYLPHLRRAVKSALLDVEARLAAGQEAVTATVDDVNGDGHEEIAVRTPSLAVTLTPAAGGALTEIGALDRRHDLADVLARRREAYHGRIGDGAEDGHAHSIHGRVPEKESGLQRLLAYDRFRRASLLDGWFGADGLLDAVEPWPAARLALGDAAFAATIERTGSSVEVALHHRAVALEVDKRVSVRGATIETRYRLVGRAGAPLDGRWAVQWNLALSAGDAPGRYLLLPGRPSLGSAGRLDDLREVTLVDEWLGLEARLTWSPGSELAWGPVETVSVSEGGFERIYQGLALLLAWPLGPGGAELAMALTVGAR